MAHAKVVSFNTKLHWIKAQYWLNMNGIVNFELIATILVKRCNSLFYNGDWRCHTITIAISLATFSLEWLVDGFYFFFFFFFLYFISMAVVVTNKNSFCWFLRYRLPRHMPPSNNNITHHKQKQNCYYCEHRAVFTNRM